MLWLMENIFDQPVKNDTRTYDKIWKIATDQRDNYTTICLLDYGVFFNSYYEVIVAVLSK